GYMHSLDSEDPAFSEHLSSAIRYALNHEEGLREFLDDPQVPLDNGFSLCPAFSYAHDLLISA
ncbi:transposase, partial [Stecheria intestinalis]